MTRSLEQRRPAFTFIEVMVILGIILLLLAFLVPAVQRVRSAAARSQSFNNLRQLALGLHSINDTYKKLPPVAGSFPGREGKGTLHFHLLPFIEQQNLYQQAKGNVWNNNTFSVPVAVFLDPQDKSAPPGNRYQGWLATSNYGANWMVFRNEDGGSANIPRTFRDGTSNTLVFAERYQMCHGQPCAWGYSSLYYWAPMFAYYSKAKFQQTPTQEQCDPALAQALRFGGIQVAMADGSARIVNEAISPETWWYACDPADGMQLGNDF